MRTRELSGLLQSIGRIGHPQRAQDFVVIILQLVSFSYSSIKSEKDFYFVGWFSKDPRHPDYVPSIFSYSQSNDAASSKLARLARAKKRRKNTNTHMDFARKAQRVDYDMSESGDVLDGMSIIRYNAQVNCDVNTDEVNTSSTVTDIDGGTIPSVSTMTDMDGGTISNVSTMADSETVQDNLFK